MFVIDMVPLVILVCVALIIIDPSSRTPSICVCRHHNFIFPLTCWRIQCPLILINTHFTFSNGDAYIPLTPYIQ